ncbi:PTS glucitol/sorbitol transporter subunit IIB [Clostridioides difficile]|uniref:PTS glucitol/sorbitol transporter subunit IIB n=1 Tax=Clostridioides difficile TaxID=1496 RepID=UPI00254FCCC3|nr:PTS glucitol/sorbitol transporter subunit IIB [Clostridioides difficile]MCJ0226058.1 PTS glucitol/sorbitol transporter subunit IIB [Clostridioides difficile]MDB3419989.1 PTS sorbitol transporter subunit IIB [Clostridioides difficile]MDL0150304.1 PTS glucitol/sorbitol transporter subunit IIB [Clostridioides difficile]MDL0280855.1 PTS glucitol/sorbitol transporter subunit IIB [Clostridioides difficile]MDL0348223.1 PTS glucitol/sorbitol transporter subunit IIB [Clostridioides difficile]
MEENKILKIEKGTSGWGGPLYIKKEGNRNKILSMTAGGIHEVTLKIKELLGCEIVDGFKTGVSDEEVAVVIIDCGGTARCGVYPKKKIPTINVNPVGKTGPLAKFITEEYYVSDVNPNCISVVDGEDMPQKSQENKSENKSSIRKPDNYDEVKSKAQGEYAKKNIILSIGQGAGQVVSKFYDAGRDTIQMVMNNVIPFMAFVSMLMGIILASGLGDWIARVISPLAGNIGGLLIISVICTLPFLSPILGPGAVIVQVVGTLVGTQIGLGAIPAYLALPALFAINGQAGCDFVPVGLSLGEAEPETVEYGVPALFYSRLITGPIAVIIAYGVAVFALR